MDHPKKHRCGLEPRGCRVTKARHTVQTAGDSLFTTRLESPALMYCSWSVCKADGLYATYEHQVIICQIHNGLLYMANTVPQRCHNMFFTISRMTQGLLQWNIFVHITTYHIPCTNVHVPNIGVQHGALISLISARSARVENMHI